MSPAALAWRQLVKEKKRVAAATAGIFFAVILMLIQLGFQDALMASAGVHVNALDGDLILASPQYQYLLQPGSFPEKRLYQATGDPRVADVAPIYISGLPWKNPSTRINRMILVMGVPVRSGVFASPEIDTQIGKLRDPENVLYDLKARSEFGPIAEWVRQGKRVETEIANRHVVVSGLFGIGTTFGVDGTVILSDQAFFHMNPTGRDTVMLGCIRLVPGADAALVRDALQQRLPADVSVFTRAGFIQQEQSYWSTNTPIGFLFKLGVAMGLIVGTIIVYQILYTDIMEHLSEYATLKAIGYNDSYLTGVVLCQGLLLSILGFVPGALVTILLYRFIAQATFLPLEMTTARMLIVYGLTAAMCLAAAAFAVRPVRTVEPAEIL